MSKRILLPIVVVSFLLFPSLVLSQTNKIENYTVKKGDTLWSISRKELGNAFLWPKVWKENPEISNPDHLYPGQTVKIPFYLKQKVLKEGPMAKATEKKMPEKTKAKKAEKKAITKRKPVKIPLKPLVGTNLLEASGYISDSVPSVGMIDGSPSGRRLFGNDDIVFVKTRNPVKIGDKFIIIKAVELETPKATRDNGYIIEPLGVVQVTKIEGRDRRARILKAFGPIRDGELLDTYQEIVPPLTTGRFRKPDINGEIIAARDLHLLNAISNIVYLDKGAKDGIEIGDMFRTVDIKSGHRIPTGTIQVIGVRNKTSTAVIRGNTGGAISAGNLFTKLR